MEATTIGTTAKALLLSGKKNHTTEWTLVAAIP
jgi:hypothetical protein